MRTLLVCLLALFIAGCGESGPAPDPKAETARLDKITDMRTIFDKSGGNYDSLSADDKAQFVKLAGGDEAKAMESWNLMKYGPAGKPQ
jgi:hypothetical protein